MRSTILVWQVVAGLASGGLLFVACGGSDGNGLQGRPVKDAGASEDAAPGAGGSAPDEAGGASTGGRAVGASGAGGTGGRAAGGASPGGGANPDPDGGTASCQNSRDCLGVSGGRAICNSVTQECVQCVQVADCDPSNDCIANACVPYTACDNSLDCPSAQVCTGPGGRCVACVTDADCAVGTEVCVANTCLRACVSDRDCTPLGLLCDRGAGHCVECLAHTDCAPNEFCSTRTCTPDVCIAGATACLANSIATCSSEGESLPVTRNCGARETCVETSSGAACQPWLCTPGTTECDPAGTRVIVCSADGLSITKNTDCTPTNEVCSQGACSALVCSPNVTRCDGKNVRSCTSDGMAELLLDTCTAQEFCDPNAPFGPACTPNLCTPNQPACDGNIATTCNADGTGYVGGAAGCGSDTCVDGVCVAVPTTYVDTVGPILTVSTGNIRFRLNDYAVTTSRTLTKIEFYVEQTTPVNLTWVVYEATLQTGTYTLISQTTSVAPIGNGYAASGPLAVPLVAGRYYAIGAGWNTEIVNYYFVLSGAPVQTSFGQSFAAELIDVYPAPASFVRGTSTNVYAQRITTTP